MYQLQTRLTAQTWGEVKAQYQRSLHEKKQYTIASDRWIPFNVNSSNCRDLEKAFPLVLAALARHDAGTPKR